MANGLARGLSRLLMAIAAIAILLVLGTLIPRPLLPAAAAGTATPVTMLLLANPIHTDLALPLTGEIRQRFANLGSHGIAINHPGAAYLLVGWGGRSFYLETPTWSDLKPGPVFRALTLDASVLHIDLAGTRLADDPSARKITLSAEGFERMLRFIETSFVTENGAPVAIDGAAYNEMDAFFEAKGFFNAFLGCNTWTAAALRTAGLRTGLWTPLPQSLALSLDLFNPSGARTD
jgi:uncharacterized protein (TIGR02117 family)